MKEKEGEGEDWKSGVRAACFGLDEEEEMKKEGTEGEIVERF